jgi:hypothetical protein
MSYDLMVFDPAKVPDGPTAFYAWYDADADAEADTAAAGDMFEDYSDPAQTTPLLRAWFLEMIKEFPAMNGAYAPDLDELEQTERAADYFIKKESIYIAFSWSDPGAAYEATFRLAAKHGAGFLDASGDGSVWLPVSPGKLKMAFRDPESS